MEEKLFEFHNEVHLRGKIFDIQRNKHSTDIFMSCGNPKERRIVKSNGMFKRDTVVVRFFGHEAKTYAENFRIGEKATVIGVIQTHVNKDTQRAKSMLVWGINMLHCEDNAKDMNDAHVRGKIISAAAISDRYLILNVKTNVKKKYKNTRENTEFPVLEKEYNSVVSIGVRVPSGDAKDLVYTTYTPGTWVDTQGKIQGRKSPKNNKHSQRYIAHKVSIVGEIQRWNLKDR